VPCHGLKDLHQFFSSFLESFEEEGRALTALKLAKGEAVKMATNDKAREHLRRNLAAKEERLARKQREKVIFDVVMVQRSLTHRPFKFTPRILEKDRSTKRCACHEEVICLFVLMNNLCESRVGWTQSAPRSRAWRPCALMPAQSAICVSVSGSRRRSVQTPEWPPSKLKEKADPRSRGSTLLGPTPSRCHRHSSIKRKTFSRHSERTSAPRNDP
jgi:hypothetical protein